MNPGDVFQPGEVIYTRKQTCHYLGGGVYIIARPAWSNGWLVERRDGFGSRYLTGEPLTTRAEADALATLEAALLPLYTGEVA